MKSEAELIEGLQKSHAKAKAQGYAALRKWGKDNRGRIRKLRRISDKTRKELTNLIGCSDAIFYYDERKKRSQPVLDKPETDKFGLEFWKGLIATRKVGDVMADALKSLFDRITDRDEEISKLIKERDECRQEVVKVQKQSAHYNEILRQRDSLLAKSAAEAMVKYGEKSLNEGA